MIFNGVGEGVAGVHVSVIIATNYYNDPYRVVQSSKSAPVAHAHERGTVMAARGYKPVL